ncbi:MAG TPA: AAA family ATPase [Thermoleophilaceae bacterium]|nr:AAA family ATPase [Thermoleophilaceae bacterium]
MTSGSATSETPLLERERELAVLDDLLSGDRAGPGLVLIEGPAGIGKSRLVGELIGRAGGAGIRVLVARGAHLERDFPFGVVRQLFEPALADAADRERLLAGAAAPATPVFEASVPAGPGDGSFAALHGLYWLAANVADESPLLLVVDDVHWCDPPSLRYLAYVARRLAGSGILLALSLRSGEPGTDPVLVAELASSPEALRVAPRPLSEAGVAGLIADRLGAVPDEPFTAACLEATGGNPLLLRQLLSSLADEDVKPVAGEVAAVQRIGPRAISRTVLVRLHRLGDQAVAVAQALAVLGVADQRSTAALAGTTMEETAAAASALARAEIIGPQAPATFVHPLVRDAIYHELPFAERVMRHARAAAVLAERDAPPEQIATHLLAAPRRGDPWVVDVLAEAAASARAKGAADTAVSLLTRAMEEPPPAERQPGLLLDLGLAETLTSGPDAATHLREAWQKLEDPRRRAYAAAILARVLFFTAPAREAAEVARRAAAEAPPELVDERQALRATELAAARYGMGGAPAAVDLDAVAIEGDGPGAKMLASMVSFWLVMTGADVERCVALAERALADDVLIAADPGLFPVPALMVLTMADRDEAVTGWEKLRALAHKRGSLLGVLSVNLWSARTFLWRGDLREAQERLEAANERFAEWGRTRSRETYAPAFLGAVLLRRGDLAGARAILATGQREDDKSDGFVELARTRTELALAEGRFDDALELTLRLERQDEVIPSFPAWLPWRSLRARALAGLGRVDEAVSLAREEVEVCRRFGGPGAVGRSLLRLGQVDPENGIEALREAVEVLGRSTARYELALANAELGTALRLARQPTDSREPLRRALELAQRCGADGLVERARTELYASGARPRKAEQSGPAALTASERRVADLAAAGKTNKEIAQTLYVTPKTVEVHLSSTYRKLGIGSRHDLAQALAE